MFINFKPALSNTAMENNLDSLEYLNLVKDFINSADTPVFNISKNKFGEITQISPKNSNYKTLSALYDEIPNFKDVKIHLSKKRDEKNWTSIKFLGQYSLLIPILPNAHESFFTNDLRLIKDRIEYDEELKVYYYIYHNNHNAIIKFIVDKKHYQGENHPKNFQAIKIKWGPH